MVRRLSVSAAVAGLVAAFASETITTTMSVPPSGSAAAITGQISGVDGLTYSNYKVMVLVSADGGATWWDKSHAPYFLKYQQDPSYDAGDAQQAAVVIQPNWSWTLQGYEASPYDATSDLWVAMVVPSSFDAKWPDYQIEGIQMPASLPQAAICYIQVSKSRGVVASGAGGCACGGPGVPNPALAINPNGAGAEAASPTPAASHSAAASPSSAASPSAAASPSSAASPSAAASPSSAATPSAAAAAPSSAAAASPSSAATTVAGSSLPEASPSASAPAVVAASSAPGGNNALPGGSASPAPGTSTLPASSPTAAASPSTGTKVSSGAGAVHSGLSALMAAVAAAVAGALVLAH